MAKKSGKQLRAEIKKLKTSKLKTKLKKLRALTEAETMSAEPAPKPVPPVSPLAPEGGFPLIPPIAGVEFATAAAGVRYAGRTDVLLVRLAPGSTLAGVFTRSATRSAAVLDGQSKIGRDSDAGAAIVVNSGNANTFTGAAGAAAVDAIVDAVAAALGVPAERVLTSSTGVIGEDLPHDRIIAAVERLVPDLAVGGIEAAARAIMTTDTFAKGSFAEVQIGDGTVKIAGIAKGSGMIAPDMATMLGYVFTDARVNRAVLQEMLRRTADRSFNRISVDSDTSTSDTVLLAATGQAACPVIDDAASPEGRAFEAALEVVMSDLAQQIVRDGEGASKFVEVRVTGAADDADAHRVARAIADSPLVKTAIAGEDPNWGRVVMAVGKSGARAERDRLAIRFGPLPVAEGGRVSADYSEAAAADYMRNAELVIGVDLGLGQGAATVWTCDLTHRYVDINADYRS